MPKTSEKAPKNAVALFPEVAGSTTIYLVSGKASTQDIVGVSSTPVENFGPFSTVVWRALIALNPTISLTTDTSPFRVEWGDCEKLRQPVENSGRGPTHRRTAHRQVPSRHDRAELPVTHRANL